MFDIKNKFIIHRGLYSYKYPENSIPAFNECVNNRYPIELDVHILKDNTIIVFHDNNLKRMCGVNSEIKNFTYEEISKYKLNNTNYIIPTFKSVLDLVKGKVLLDIELKCDKNYKLLINNVIDILKNYNGEFILKSFDPRIVKYLKTVRKDNNMNFKTGLLIKKSSHLIPSLLYSNPEFISFHFDNYNKTIFKFVSKFKDTLLYTFKNSKDFNSYKDLKVNFIVENVKNLINIS